MIAVEKLFSIQFDHSQQGKQNHLLIPLKIAFKLVYNLTVDTQPTWSCPLLLDKIKS